MSKIYIAGPMSGLPGFNRPAFHRAAAHIVRRGNVALNPAILPDGLEQAEYMDICLAMLRCADGIFMLDGWQQSAGAKAEYALAEKLGMDIQHQVIDRCSRRVEGSR
ncbi:DUF4406 domain-containing protein [Citrobacter portucalensis]|uniref:DUF4406 domain-containing protein n=1 Tax=Citrobacter portucalensis TaxID=1639133 RepID=UPI004033A266